MELHDLAATPNALAPHYSRFRVAERLLLTGHSHQAWPDRGFEGQQRAWLDAAEFIDDKWERAFQQADRVRRGYARLLEGDDDDDARARLADSIALASNTHELVVRFLSALPLRDRPRLVTTDGEFHTLRRQLDRLAEEGIEVVEVPAAPADHVADRLARAVDDRTAAVLTSSVFFRDARIVPGLGHVMAACNRVGAELLVDAYHHLNVVPFSLRAMRLEDAFIVGGGYKYCQLGEGNAFLRAPEGREPRPVITGWFSEFGLLAEASPSRDDDAARAGAASARRTGATAHAGSGARPRVAYGAGHARFAGATYDPTSHYRAAEVFDFFDEMRLTPAFLREVSQHQIRLLARTFDALDLDPAIVDRDRDVDLGDVAGFLALRSPHAGELQRKLRERGVLTDHRGDVLRLGPAPYLSDRQLEDAVAALGECARELRR
ncbi:MAG TPA: hypothetical protein VF158_00950 [Longimicrobiales bacterium]